MEGRSNDLSCIFIANCISIYFAFAFASCSLEIADSPTSTHSITLHSAPSLKILSAVLSSSSLKSTSAVLAQDIVYDSKLERITVVFPKEIVALAKDQKYKLGLRFEGEIEGSMMGYYKSVYEDAQGNKAHYALSRRTFSLQSRDYLELMVAIIQLNSSLLPPVALSHAGTSLTSRLPSDSPFSPERV